MDKEILAIPDQYVFQIVLVIEAGLDVLGDEISQDVIKNLNEWCAEMKREQGA